MLYMEADNVHNCAIMDNEKGELRGVVSKMLARAGHGAIGDLAEKAGVHRATIKRFVDGNPVSLRSLEAIRKALDAASASTPDQADPENSSPPCPPDVEAWWKENRRQLRKLLSGDPAARLASRLESLADVLYSDTHSPDEKVQEFVSFVRNAHANLEAHAARLKKSAQDV